MNLLERLEMNISLESEVLVRQSWVAGEEEARAEMRLALALFELFGDDFAEIEVIFSWKPRLDKKISAFLAPDGYGPTNKNPYYLCSCLDMEEIYGDLVWITATDTEMQVAAPPSGSPEFDTLLEQLTHFLTKAEYWEKGELKNE